MTVRRIRRLALEELAPYILNAPDPPAALSWRAVFGNEAPVEIEVGFGKGLFLLTASEARPDLNFLGIEIVRKYQLYTATRLTKRQRSNVRVACADAKPFLHNCVAAASVQAIHVYFPDPWWKKRHQKRRLFTPEFAVVCERILQPRGRLYLVTDVADYFEVMKEVVAQHTHLQPLPPPDLKKPAHDLDYLTNFERKFRKEGRPIYRAIYERLERIQDLPSSKSMTENPLG